EEEREEPEELLPPEDEDLDEELEEELLEKRAGPKRRARPARRELEEELFDDVLGEDDEPLPTLFGSDDEEEDVAAGGSVSVYVAGPQESVGTLHAEKLSVLLKQVSVRHAPSHCAYKDDKKRPKRVVTELKALAVLLKQE